MLGASVPEVFLGGAVHPLAFLPLVFAEGNAHISAGEHSVEEGLFVGVGEFGEADREPFAAGVEEVDQGGVDGPAGC